ncbi:MAG: hypothetical protein KGH75_13550, partial [Rhodospirillales bacterium]|nr:hypothetical protein [Rhodospirillales bacterium]
NNVTQLHNALQHGIDQVFEAYQINNKMEEHSTFINSKMKEMQTWLPNLSYIRRSTKNNSPQFFVLNVKKDGNFNKQLFENGFRDYPDGSTGSICAFGRNAGILLGTETGGTVRKLIKSYCLSEASGFAKVWDYKDGTNNQINIYSSDGLRIYVNGSGGTGYVKVNTMNQQQVYVKPTVEDKSQNEKCTFKYPILVKRYGMYTSLDKYSGNTAVSFGLYLGRDILTCTGAKDYMVYYSAASINYNNYFGFIDPYIGSVFAGRIPISPYASYNVKLCPASNGNPAYLSHLDNLCMEWE